MRWCRKHRSFVSLYCRGLYCGTINHWNFVFGALVFYSSVQLYKLFCPMFRKIPSMPLWDMNVMLTCSFVYQDIWLCKLLTHVGVLNGTCKAIVLFSRVLCFLNKNKSLQASVWNRCLRNLIVNSLPQHLWSSANSITFQNYSSPFGVLET